MKSGIDSNARTNHMSRAIIFFWAQRHDVVTAVA
jgi:hypothetical protein